MPTKKNHLFTSARFFEVPKSWRPDPARLSTQRFVPTGSRQEIACGFLPPRGGDEPGDWPFVEVVSGLHFVRLRTQTRSVPSSAIAQEVRTMCQRIEQETGRSPGKRERKNLKEDARQKLLPRAFTRDADSWGAVCPERGILAVNSASPNTCARISSELVCLHTLSPEQLHAQGMEANVYARPVRTSRSVDSFMLQALTSPDSVGPFAPATLCVLASQDESRRQVTYRNHELAGNEEIQRHLQFGHSPTRLGLYVGSSAHFEIDSTFGLHKIGFADDLFSQDQGSEQADADAFDTDLTLVGLGLFSVFDALTSQLGLERLDQTA